MQTLVRAIRLMTDRLFFHLVGLTMFNGIIRHLGVVVSGGTGSTFVAIKSPLFVSEPPAVGASIAVDGVCLSVSQHEGAFADLCRFELGQETLNVTLLGQKKAGDLVNLEAAIKMGQPIDGHMMQGHVDGKARLINRQMIDNSLLLGFSFSPKLDPYLVVKGSIAINGVSLTLNQVESGYFEVCLVPITQELTNLSRIDLGADAHIETDVMGRYLLKASGHLDPTTRSFAQG